jgi:hypothetical protein
MPGAHHLLGQVGSKHAVMRRLTADATMGFSESELDVLFRFLNTVVERLGDAD